MTLKGTRYYKLTVPTSSDFSHAQSKSNGQDILPITNNKNRRLGAKTRLKNLKNKQRSKNIQAPLLFGYNQSSYRNLLSAANYRVKTQKGNPDSRTILDY